MGMFTEIYYEVDLRERKTGNSVETIYSGTDSAKAYESADKWKNLFEPRTQTRTYFNARKERK